ncbi:PTS transporter subunit EIIC [Mycoplasma sp. SG1]|uniref:PTS transporter subunit EIIC n=1 Tax=Mycoplasma sp. SG1 TaxID=2810348 RepID=UPI0020243FEB|nr:PTS transporter subunit EIIC [Mycoplasma sp. SG1]URM53225.1 PTS transporter subunit EIIC [Mycoplasma sp. SG1]
MIKLSKLTKWRNRAEDINPNPKKGAAKAFFKNIGFAFLLPIAILPLAGILLGIGTTLTNQVQDPAYAGYALGQFMSYIGNILFWLLPVFFAMATAMALTKNNAFAGFSAALGFFVFIVIQTPFIKNPSGGDFSIFFWKNLPQYIFDALTTGFPSGNKPGYVFLNSSIFGGIIVGMITAWIFKRGVKWKLPNMISFFQGNRLIPFLVTGLMIPLAFIMLVIWPAIGLGLNWIGTSSNHLPYGFDVFIGNWLERLLVPFGLHVLIFYTLIWTQAGGHIDQNMINNTAILYNGEHMHLMEWFTKVQHFSPDQISSWLSTYGNGDQHIWLFFQNAHLPYDSSFEALNSNLPSLVGISPGRYMSGRFPFMMFGLPAAAVAMWLTTPKGNRKIATGILGSGIATCFITGTTQPIEFSFLFTSPLLYWGPYSILVASVGLVMKDVGAHLNTMYSGGLIDFIFYAALPDINGLKANSYWVPIVGICYVPIFFALFYFWIKGFKVELFSSSHDHGNITNVHSTEEQSANKFIEAAGGKENVETVTNCATSIRVTFKDYNHLKYSVWKTDPNVITVVPRDDNFYQVVYREKVLSIKKEIDKILHPELFTQDKSDDANTQKPKNKISKIKKLFNFTPKRNKVIEKTKGIDIDSFKKKEPDNTDNN